MSSSFPAFVNMVRRKINNKMTNAMIRAVYQAEIDDILSTTLNEQGKITLMINLLNGLKIPLGVEGAGISKRLRLTR
jgi:hypothetical protein